MLDQALARANRWALDHVEPEWVDYVVSNTMTDFNRRLNGFLWTYDLKAQVVQVLDEAPGVKTFVLRPNQHWSEFQPGQHVEVILSIDGQEVRRCYSLSALSPGRVAITVKRVDQGQASRWMHEYLHEGMTLQLGQPQGQFCYQGQAKVLYLCAGSGITPCHSMVNALLAKPESERPDIQVIAQFRQSTDVIFKDALLSWGNAGLKVTTALSDWPASQPCLPGRVPRLDAVQLQRLCPDLLERDVFLCGPAGFMAQIMADLQSLGVDLFRVHTERFVVPEPEAPSDQAFEVAGAEVIFQHLHASITLSAEDQGKTLLQLGREHGLHLESGCCQGMCGTCKLMVHEGKASGNVLGKAVYLCTSYPASHTLVIGA
jgi:ferredoxin-NADP reductase